MCVFKLFVLILFRVTTLNTPRMKVAVVVVLVVGIGLGQLHDGLGVGVHGRERDADGVEPERGEERQARPLEAPLARVPGAAERHNNSDEAVGCNLVPPCPPRLVLAPQILGLLLDMSFAQSKPWPQPPGTPRPRAARAHLAATR